MVMTATQLNTAAFGPHAAVDALPAIEYANYIKTMVAKAFYQRHIDAARWTQCLTEAISAIPATATAKTAMAMATYDEALATVYALEALGEQARAEEKKVTASVLTLGHELVRMSDRLIDEHDKHAALEYALKETQRELTKRDAEVAALQAALAITTTDATVNANANANEAAKTKANTTATVKAPGDMATSAGSRTRSKTAASCDRRSSTSSYTSSSSSTSGRPAWNSSTRAKTAPAGRPATPRARPHALTTTTTTTSKTTKTAVSRGAVSPIETRMDTATSTVHPQKKPQSQKKTKQSPEPTQQKKLVKPTSPKQAPRPRPLPPAQVARLDWAVLECAAEQARTGHALAPILCQLQEIAAWRVGFVKDTPWVLRGDDHTTVPSTISSAKVVHALDAQAKLLGTLEDKCTKKLKAVSLSSPDRQWLVERQQQLLGEMVVVRTSVAELAATLGQIAVPEANEAKAKADAGNQDGGCVWQCRKPVGPEPTVSDVREEMAQRAKVDVNTDMVQSIVLAVRGFHMDCLGAWAASLDIDATHTKNVELMVLGTSVLREIKARIKKQAEPCQWLDTSSLFPKLATANAQIHRKLDLCSQALVRLQGSGIMEKY